MSLHDITENGPVLGLGLAALGRPGYINLGHADDLERDYSVAAMQQRAHQVLDAAWDSGVRYFDTARSYGKAEPFLASWLEARAIRPNDVFVASKWGYSYTADWQVNVPAGESHEVKQHSLERLNQQWPESDQLLGKYLNLYQIHSATLESGVLTNRDVLSRLAELRDSGTRIGLSVSGTAQADTVYQAIDCEVGGKQVFSAVQATWNLLENSAGPALQAASDAGWTVIVKEGVANGRLTDRNEDPAFARHRRSLQSLADRFDVSIDAVALAAIGQQPWANVILSGAATPPQFRSNAQAIEVARQLNSNEIAEQLASYTEASADYWQQRSALDWN